MISYNKFKQLQKQFLPECRLHSSIKHSSIPKEFLWGIAEAQSRSSASENDPEYPGDSGMDLVLNAAYDGNVRLLVYLKSTQTRMVRNATFSTTRARKDGATPLSMAVISNQIAAVKWLINNGAQCDVTTPNNLGNTPLMSALKNVSIKMISMLLKHGATETINNYGWGFNYGCGLIPNKQRQTTALFQAVACGLTPPIVRLLIHHGADVDKTTGLELDLDPIGFKEVADEGLLSILDNENGTLGKKDPVLGNNESYMAMVSAAKDYISQSTKITPLYIAAMSGRLDICEILIEPTVTVKLVGLVSKPELNGLFGTRSTYDEKKKRYLILLYDLDIPNVNAKEKNFVVSRVKPGADVRATNMLGHSLLHSVCRPRPNSQLPKSPVDPTKTLNWLLDHGASKDVCKTDEHNWTPLLSAVKAGDIKRVQWLYKHGGEQTIDERSVVQLKAGFDLSKLPESSLGPFKSKATEFKRFSDEHNDCLRRERAATNEEALSNLDNKDYPYNPGLSPIELAILFGHKKIVKLLNKKWGVPLPSKKILELAKEQYMCEETVQNNKLGVEKIAATQRSVTAKQGCEICGKQRIDENSGKVKKLNMCSGCLTVAYCSKTW